MLPNQNDPIREVAVLDQNPGFLRVLKLLDDKRRELVEAAEGKAATGNDGNPSLCVAVGYKRAINDVWRAVEEATAKLKETS